MRMQYLIGAITSQLKEQQYSYQQALNNKEFWELKEIQQRIKLLTHSLSEILRVLIS